MLDLIGRGYVIEHCITSFKNKKQNEAYKIYMSDAMFTLVNGYGKTHGASDNLIKERYIEIIAPPKENVKEETAEDIINRIKKGLEG